MQSPAKATIETGQEYRMAGYTWIAAEVNGDYAVLQSCGVTDGPWPGYALPLSDSGRKNWWSEQDIDDLDIHAYNDKTIKLYEQLKDVEYTDAEYGKGLYLISYREYHKKKEYYKVAFQKAITNLRLSGLAFDRVWLSDANKFDHTKAEYIDSDGICCNEGEQSYPYAVAPAFNLDVRKVKVSGDEIKVL